MPTTWQPPAEAFREPESGWAPPPESLLAPAPADLSPANAILRQGAPARATAYDYASQLLHGLGRGTAAIPGLAGDIPTLAGAGLEWLGGKVAPKTTAAIANTVRPITSLLTPPTSAETIGAAERNLIGGRPEPKSAGARFAGNVAQYIPGSLLPLGGGATTANVVRQGLLGAASGAASEGAREAELPAGAQVAAGLLPGGLLGAGRLLSGRTGAGGLVRNATAELSPEDWQRGAALQTQAREVGVPLMGSEALAPSVGPGALGQLASDIKATSRGAPILNPVFEKRPTTITSAVRRAVAPIGPSASADEVLSGVKQTAIDAIAAAKAERTRVTSPLFQAAGKGDIPADAVTPILGSIDAALAEAGSGTKLGGALSKLRSQLTPAPSALPSGVRMGPAVETRISRLQNVYQELRDSMDDPAMLEGSLRKQAGILRPIAGQLQSALADNNIIYRQANDLYARMSGPVRALAGDSDNPALVARVADAPNNESLRRLMLDPENVSPETVATLGTLFEGKPQALSAWTRHYLENALDKTSKRLQSGENPALGANWSNLVAGTPQTRGVLDAYLQQVDPSGGAQRGLGRLLQVLERTAKTPGTGSPTAQRLQLGEGLSGGPASTAAQVGAGAVMAATGLPAGQLAGGYLVAGGVMSQIRRAYLNMGAAKIAKALTDPDSVGKLRALARKDAASPAAATSVLAILGGRAESKE